MLKLRENEYIVDGTPADCVNLAILKLMQDDRPALVVSGINFGPNLGDDVTYSGTISAAFEGALLDVPSIAFSTLVGEGLLVRSLRRVRGEADPLGARPSSRSAHHPQRQLPGRVQRRPRGAPRQSHLRRATSSSARIRAAARTTGSAAASRPGVPAKDTDFEAVEDRLHRHHAAAPRPHPSRIDPAAQIARGAPWPRQRSDSAPQPDFAHLRARMVQRLRRRARHQRRANPAGHARRAAAPLRPDARRRESVRRRRAADRREANDLAAVHRGADDRAARSHRQRKSARDRHRHRLSGRRPLEALRESLLHRTHQRAGPARRGADPRR